MLRLPIKNNFQRFFCILGLSLYKQAVSERRFYGAFLLPLTIATISTIRRNIASLNVAQEAETAIQSSSTIIIREQKNQLLRGLKADGSRIGVYRNIKYAAKKAQQNPLPGFGFVDWKLTGALYSDIFLDVRPQSFVLDSIDSKTGDLMKKYGDPFGLTFDSRVIVINEKLRKELIFNIKSKLFR